MGLTGGLRIGPLRRATEEFYTAGTTSHTGLGGTRMLSLTANLGDAKSTIVHPATTTHSRLSPAQREQSGIADGLVRVAVGLEDVEDIKADLARGFDALSA